MARHRQLVLLKPAPSPDGTVVADLDDLGTMGEVLAVFAAFNTSADGSGAGPSGSALLYGPGMVVEIPTPPDRDPVRQAMITVKDEDLAWSVLWRLCRKHGWKMMDTETGQSFG